jgi:hypothetical protein
VLTCHLKRFQQDGRGRLRKINGTVPFPRELDVSQFCDPKVPLALCTPGPAPHCPVGSCSCQPHAMHAVHSMQTYAAHSWSGGTGDSFHAIQSVRA